MKLSRPFLATGIGSLPYSDANQAISRVLEHFPEIPFWPQLPRRSYLENMYVQYSEGLPNVKIDQQKKTIYVDTQTDLTGGLEVLYEHYFSAMGSEDVEFFKMSPERAAGFYAFIEALKGGKPSCTEYVKGQITGPVSFGLTVTDENKKSIYYNDELKEALTKLLEAKAVWQIRRLKEIHPQVIIFIDEPYLVSVGSSFVSIQKDDVIKRLNEIIEAIHKEKAFAGVHCCGNTDWSILLDTDIDILNFDAYDYLDALLLYPEKLRLFFGRGGVVAPGIVPTSEKILQENSNSLWEKLNRYLDKTSAKGISRETILEQSLLTPACGCGSLTETETQRVLLLLGGLSSQNAR